MSYSPDWPTLRQGLAVLPIYLLCLLLLTGCGPKPSEMVTQVQHVREKVGRDLTARHPAPLPPRRADYRDADKYNEALGRYIADSYVSNVQCNGRIQDIELLHGDVNATMDSNHE